MAGASILEAVEKLEAGTIAKRSEGLDDLKRILTRAPSSSKLHSLEDHGWHKILDLLFALVKSDKSDVLGGSATAKKRAVNRLETVASALRVVVSFCNCLIRHKTAFAVLDHVCSILSSTQSRDEDFRRPIQSEYFRVFRIIVSDQAHAEHLRPKDWGRYVDFVLDAINDGLSSAGDQEDGYDDAVLASGTMSTNASTSGTIALRPSQASSSRGSRVKLPHGTDELIIALVSLTGITNCPLQVKLPDIAQTILAALATPIQNKDAAFECLNNVIMVALTESTALVSHIGTQVLPLIRRLWSDKVDHKSTSFREQMLITLLLLRQRLKPPQPALDDIDTQVVASVGSHLLDTYDSRSDQDSLQISDLMFSISDTDDLFSRRGVAPDIESASATLSWCTVAMIAMLRAASPRDAVSQGTEGDLDEGPRKRQRKSVALPDLLKLLMIDEVAIDAKEAQEFLVKMLPEIVDDRAGRSSWILLVLSRLSRTAIAQQEGLLKYWWQAWNAASQLVTSDMNSRAACFTMTALIETGIVDTFLSSSNLTNFCFLSGTRGPPTLTDSALLLFSSCLRSGLLRTERQSQDFSNKVLSWLDTVWSLPATKGHARNVDVARMGRPDLLYDLFNALTRTTNSNSQRSRISSPSTLYHAYQQQLEDYHFIEYLNGATPTDPPTYPSASLTKHRTADKIGPPSGKQSRDVVCRFLQKKLDDLAIAYRDIELVGYKENSHDRTEHIRRANLTVEMAEILCTACTVSALLTDKASNLYLHTSIKQSWQCVLDYMWLHRHEETAFETSAIRVTQKLLAIRANSEQQSSEAQRSKAELAKSLRETFAKRGDGLVGTKDLDLEFSTSTGASQPSQAKSQRLNQENSRREAPFSTNCHSQFIQVEAMLLEECLSADISERASLSSAMVDFSLGLPAQELLSARAVLINFLENDSSLTTSDAARILRRVAEVCLQDDENERNEAALCFCLKLMQSTVHLWVDTPDEDLAEVAMDIYSYFIEVALGKGIASTRVLYNISVLIGSLLRHKPRYGTEVLSSPRTSLLHILKDGTSGLRYRILPTVSTLFEGYVLAEHGAIFDDIVDRLPTEANDPEGIAVRLYALARLGSTWKTCLRQAAYHIFETAANVPLACSFAHECLKMVAKDVGLERGPGHVLHLFAPQIFYTWLEDGSINTMPFSAFGYSTLKDLVEAEIEELVAQAVLRHDKRHQELLESMLGLSWTDMLQTAFARAQVYAIATDVVEDKVVEGPGLLETAIRKLIGESAYSDLSKKHFPEAVAHIILSLSEDRGFDKLLGSSSRYKSMLHTYEAIRSHGASSVVHPARQQPSFRVKYLMPILAKVCMNSETNPDSFWTSSILTYVYREILDDANAALGPLHVASTIRKIRVAVTMAGSTALRGYPLEMLLHSLRPYVTYFHCAEDTIGIYWYLLEQGKKYLQARLSFIAGLGAAIFTALSVFATSSQESTTQESQFIATMARAREFRIWLDKYLQGFDTSQLSPGRDNRLRTIIHHAKEMNSSGTNSRHESEGILLYHILLDQSSEEPLVPQKFFNTVIRGLSQNFLKTANFTDDILESEETTVAVAPVLREVLEQVEVSESFTTWIGSVLGRAYAFAGPSLELALNHKHENVTAEDESSLAPNHSRRKILLVLVDLVWGEDAAAASMAERTLSFVLSSLPRKERQEMLSSVTEGGDLQDLIFESSFCPEPSYGHTSRRSVEDVSNFGSFPSNSQWAALLAASIIMEDAGDAFLSGLLPLLDSHQTVAHKILPMIAHLVLDGQVEHQQVVHGFLSKLFNAVLNGHTTRNPARVVLSIVSYLRRCIYPGETTYAKRNGWIDINYEKAAAAALDCGMPHTALLMLEIEQSEQALQVSRSRRSSVKTLLPETNVNMELLSRIFRSVQDADFFYGCHEEADVNSVLAKLQHEGEGSRVLAMQSALFDSSMKAHGAEAAYQRDGQGVVSALSSANLNGLAYATQQYVGADLAGDEGRPFGQALLNVHQWDVSPADKTHHTATLATVLQKLATSQSYSDMQMTIDAGLHSATRQLLGHRSGALSNTMSLIDLAALSEVQMLAMTTSIENLDEAWTILLEPMAWVGRAR